MLMLQQFLIIIFCIIILGFNVFLINSFNNSIKNDKLGL